MVVILGLDPRICRRLRVCKGDVANQSTAVDPRVKPEDDGVVVGQRSGEANGDFGSAHSALPSGSVPPRMRMSKIMGYPNNVVILGLDPRICRRLRVCREEGDNSRRAADPRVKPEDDGVVVGGTMAGSE